MLRPRTLLAPGLALALALTFGVGRASADIFDLTTTNLSGFTGPFAQVTATLNDSTHATITFDSLANGGYTYLFAGGAGIAVVGANLNNGTLTSFSGTPFQSPGGTLSNGGTGNFDGLGSTNTSVNDSGSGPSNAFTEIVLHVTASGSTTWTSITGGSSPLLTGSPILAAHVGALVSGSTTFTATGDVAGAQPHVTPPLAPEPSSMLLVSVGTIGLVGYGIRRRRKS
jgi:hypothetical protein